MLAKSLALIAAASLAIGCREAPEPATSPKAASSLEAPRLGLMTTLPLLWTEGADIGELLSAENKAGWVRQELAAGFVIEPLDTLDEAALAPLDRLVLAQPRPLSPAENVALDNWVRRGGRLLLFADPMLTRHSQFPIGDRRRPQDVILLSPILTHWGLELLFDDEQAAGGRNIAVAGAEVPVNLPGTFRLVAGAPCTLGGSDVLARCSLGEGRVVALADAAVLDDAAGGNLAAHRAALRRLLAAAFE